MTSKQLQSENEFLKKRLESKSLQAKILEEELANVKGSLAWKLTMPYRFFLECAKKLVRIVCVNFTKVKKYLFIGLPASWAWRFRREFFISPKAFCFGRSACESQKSVVFSRQIKFSFLCPVATCSRRELQETVASVLFQTYANWELILVGFDGGNADFIKALCEEAVARDSRIKFILLDSEQKISLALAAAEKKASGDFFSILFTGDLLHPSALYEMMDAICNKGPDFVYVDSAVFRCGSLHKIVSTNFKPDFSLDYFKSFNYIGHFAAFSKKVFKSAGGFDNAFESACVYDLFLRIFERTKKITHVKKCLFYSRLEIGAGNASFSDRKKVLEKHFTRLGIKASVLEGAISDICKVDYKIEGKPLVSILIPSSDNWMVLKKCLDSIRSLTTYKNYEIIIIENNSVRDETFAFYDSLKNEKNISVVVWKGEFNYPAINNYGAKAAKGDYYILLNDDTEVISPKWIEEMLMYAQRNDVGAVGAMLYYPDKKIQHAGVIFGMRGVADHSHKFFPMGSLGYANRLVAVQNLSCLSAACMMVSRKVFKQVGGLDETFEVAFNDVDFCMRIRKAGYLIVWTPYAELFHYESVSRGCDFVPKNLGRFVSEARLCQIRWSMQLLAGDPYYNPNLTLYAENFDVVGDVFPMLMEGV